ncbi:GcrA family cell cycle regulator [Methylobacterium sp. 092160098-2]|uniref:GcrA family cell cycle regulator n=1 Tax=Methylobacterium sp. 092160098-2 TaxID=3025129 RepID=UPI002381A5AA|nr:GcrA family cell cycle regulator [Methylobacterium sp. 092160098-2]MDE4914297.1 GcrA family cell cycle regulator [Methylobacterium sp. 092160098-2]
MAVDSVWSEEKVAELRRLWIDEKLSGAQIATALGLKDRNAVMGKIHRLGITRKTAEARGDEPAVVASRQSLPDETPADAGLPDATAAAVDEVVSATPEAPAPSPQPPAEVSAAGSAEDSFSGHPIMQLTESSCRWPIGDPMAAGFRFCCKPKAGPLPYCSEHAQMSYLPSESRTRRPLPPKAA